MHGIGGLGLGRKLWLEILAFFGDGNEYKFNKKS